LKDNAKGFGAFMVLNLEFASRIMPDDPSQNGFSIAVPHGACVSAGNGLVN